MTREGLHGDRLPSLRLAVGTFTIVPVPPPREIGARTAGRAMALAPAIGLALGAAAGGAALIGDAAAGPAFGAVAAITTLAVLTRALHLDGLADTADGLGSARRGSDGVAVMRRSDIGPFGVATLTLVLLADTALVAQSVASGDRFATVATLAVAASVGRCGVTWCVRRGAVAASDTGLGSAVIGTVPPVAASVAVVLTAAVAGLVLGLGGVVAATTGLVAAVLVARTCHRRFGGQTGDTLGAVVELGTLASLLGAVAIVA